MTKRERAARERLTDATWRAFSLMPTDENVAEYRRALAALLRVVRQEARDG